ncbi:hypothetical protein KZZ52_55820 [Dactylosporangium sp. AC04546]|uniref:hypothetical protein n=1 Tax=Dactylosporangium sp. AC04546 TaxID=2862460 RepID=UPI001EDE3E32|nr:hypothetical protein [Dactylosporangium sp. AC04546]WVK83093.1 hypothetical protein KZZ52_55820 [Dactylosporangium sp. AC04546]
MSGRKISVAAVALAGTIAALALGRVIWPDPAGAPTPPRDLLPLFVVLSVLEALAFGAGLAFACFGLAPLRRLGAGAALTWAAHVSISFMLVSWWPHDNLHRVLGHADFAGLAWIEYLFHVPLMAGAAVVAVFFLRIMRGGDRVPA